MTTAQEASFWCRCALCPFLSGLMLLFGSGCSLLPSQHDMAMRRVNGPGSERPAKSAAPRQPAQARYAPPGARPLPEPELEVTREVKRELAEFLRGNCSFIKQALSRRNEHYPSLLAVFSEWGIPIDLLNLALIESGFRSEARSAAGAVGMWQFMRPTAKRYGLATGLFEDERKDPVRSTTAAARHLKDLFDRYQDWNLALAAYNSGEYSVSRALGRLGANSDFWTLARAKLLSEQTARFVPRFIAATILVKTIEAYGPENVAQNLMRNVLAYDAANRKDEFAFFLTAGNANQFSRRTRDRHSPVG